MGPDNGPISIPPNLRIEELFVAYLQAAGTLDGLEIVCASDRSVTVPPLHCFVYCPTATPVMQFGQNYRADVTVTVVTNIDDTDHATRKEWFNKVLAALTRQQTAYAPDDEGTLISWPIKVVGEVSDGQQTGDTIKMNAAAYVAG